MRNGSAGREVDAEGTNDGGGFFDVDVLGEKVAGAGEGFLTGAGADVVAFGAGGGVATGGTSQKDCSRNGEDVDLPRIYRGSSFCDNEEWAVKKVSPAITSPTRLSGES